MNKIITLFASSLVLVGFGLENASALELPACVNKKTGAWRIVAAVKKCNAKTENAVLLNSTGQAGVAGIAGAVGPQGPQGVKGDKGDKGDTGAVGPKGSAAANSGISVYDANNQFLGVYAKEIMIGLEGTSYEIFVPAPVAAFVTIRPNGTISDTYDPSDEYSYPLIYSRTDDSSYRSGGYFTSNDCSGPSFTETTYQRRGSKPLLIAGTGTAADKYFIYKEKNTDRGIVTLKSASFDSSCFPRNVILYTAPQSFERTEVSLPFTMPIAIPLRLE